MRAAAVSNQERRRQAEIKTKARLVGLPGHFVMLPCAAWAPLRGMFKETFPINFGFNKINKGLRAASAVLESHLTVLEKFQKSYLNVGRN